MTSIAEQDRPGIPDQSQTGHMPPKISAFLMNSDLSTGGTERQFALMAGALSKGHFDVQLGCMKRRGAFLKGLGDISEFDVAGSFFNRQAHRARRQLRRHLLERRVVIAHAFDFYADLMLIPVARWAGIPVVIGSQRQLGDLLGPMQRIALHSVFRFCTRVVCNSRAAALRLGNEGIPNSKILVIPNGLPEEAFLEFEPHLGQRPEFVRVGLVGRMNHPAKNQDLFLLAAARVAKRFPHAEFVLVGDGPLRKRFELLSEELGLGHRVKFLGERMDVSAILTTFDISVVVSDSEGLSNVILESMAAGKPVIATRVGGNAELVRDGETGLLIPRKNVDALVRAIEEMLGEPVARRNMGENARTLARREFSLKAICAQYEELYFSLLDEKGSTKPGPTSVHF